MNQARAIVPNVKVVSPKTLIHFSVSIAGCCINSAEQGYQNPSCTPAQFEQGQLEEHLKGPLQQVIIIQLNMNFCR